MLRLLVQGFAAGGSDCVVFRLSTGVSLAPAALDPAVLLEPHEGGIEGALIQVEEAVGNLLEARGDLVGVLRSHRRQVAQDDQVQCSLENLRVFLVFTWHPSGHSRDECLRFALGCQVNGRLRCCMGGNEGNWEMGRLDRKSTRLNSSHLVISYAVFCLKKKKK